MNKRIIPALAGLALIAMSTGCTPEEIQTWIAQHPAEQQAPAPAVRSAVAAPDQPIPWVPGAAPTCEDGYVPVESVGGPLCVGAIYVDPNSPLKYEDPATCEHGYYQGSCA
jgi:hypothetical protein